MAACARLFTSWRLLSESGNPEPNRILSPSCEPVVVAETGGESAADEWGRSMNFSSADEAVDGRRSCPRDGFAGRGSRGAGESVICGELEVRESEASLSEGTGAADCTGSDRERSRWLGCLSGACWRSVLAVVTGSMKIEMGGDEMDGRGIQQIQN